MNPALLLLVLLAGAAQASPAERCHAAWKTRADGKALAGLPAVLATLPEGAVLCTSMASFRIAYYAWERSPEETLAWWEARLKAQGFVTQRVKGATPGKTLLRFSGPSRGKISLSPTGRGYAVTLGSS